MRRLCRSVGHVHAFPEPVPTRRVAGLVLPAVSLGLWQNFGQDTSFDAQRALVLRAVDRGVFHLDLANNYGPRPSPPRRPWAGCSTGRLAAHRDDLVITTKAGYRAWSGPYGEHGSAKYLRASLDRSLRALRTDHVDVFYSHRYDPATPLAETLGALAAAVRAGKARAVGISSYSADRTREALQAAGDLGIRLTAHQSAYSMLNRWVERPGSDGRSLLDVVGDAGMGMVAFSPLAQGMLSTRYLHGVPAGSRAARGGPLRPEWLTEEALGHVRALDEIARAAGRTLPQARAGVGAPRSTRDDRAGRCAYAPAGWTRTWPVRRPRRSPRTRLAAVEPHAVDAGINLWGSRSSDL